MDIPREPAPGQPITAAWAAGVCRALRAQRIASFVNGTVSRTANGITLRGNPGGAPPADQLLPPFWLYESAPDPVDPEAPRNTIRVTPGTVGTVLPSNYDELLTLTSGGAGVPTWVWLEVTAEYESGVAKILTVLIDSGAIVPDDETPGPGEPPSTFYVPIGVAQFDDDGNIQSLQSTLQRSVFPQVVVTDVDCSHVRRAILI